MKYSLATLFLVLASLAQDMPPHRSAITPPPEPMDMPFLHRMPTNFLMLHVPIGKKAELFWMGNMQLEELTECFRTNKYHCGVVVFTDAGPPPLRSALNSPEDELDLSNFHRGMPQQP
jgi:hypothetical protein